MKNEHTRFLCKQAKKRKINCKTLKASEDFCLLSKGKKKILIYGGIVSDNTSASSYILCQDKAVAHEFLKMHKFPVLPQIKTSSLTEARKFLDKHKKVVVKPIKQKQGKGVSVSIKSNFEIEKAWQLADKFGKSKVIEKHFDGIDHRVLVINYKDVYVIQRFPAYVIGDGKNSIKKLIEIKNKIKLIGKRKKPIKIDEGLKLYLKQNKLSLNHVPKDNEKVIVRGTSNVHTGGETKDFTANVSATVKKEAIKIAKLLKLNALGIDYLAKDINKKRYIIELESEPGVQLHHFPIEGKPQDPIEKFLDMLFKK